MFVASVVRVGVPKFVILFVPIAIEPVIVPPVVGNAVDVITKSVAVDVDVEIPVPETLIDFVV